MDIVHCSFCKHSNPADAKFCNACGSSLALQLCEACGAIDNVSATVCHKCGHPFAP
nr:zinc ribbon domain-containing protein [Thauera sp.]